MVDTKESVWLQKPIETCRPSCWILFRRKYENETILNFIISFIACKSYRYKMYCRLDTLDETVIDMHNNIKHHVLFMGNACSSLYMVNLRHVNRGHLLHRTPSPIPIWDLHVFWCWEKGRYLTQTYDKGPYTHRKIQKQRDNINTTKNLDYTTIADRLRTVSWSNNSLLTDVVKLVIKVTNLPTYRKSSVFNRTWHDRNIVYNTNRLSQR